MFFDDLPQRAHVEIVMEGGWPSAEMQRRGDAATGGHGDAGKSGRLPESLSKPFAELRAMKPKTEFEKAYLAEALRAFEAYRERASRDAAGAYSQMKPEKRAAILKMYEDAAVNLYRGFDGLMKAYAAEAHTRKRKVGDLWAGL